MSWKGPSLLSDEAPRLSKRYALESQWWSLLVLENDLATKQPPQGHERLSPSTCDNFPGSSGSPSGGGAGSCVEDGLRWLCASPTSRGLVGRCFACARKAV